MHEPLRRIAPALLERIHGKTRRKARHVNRLSRPDLHALRKSLKKVRYDSRSLGGLFPRRKVTLYRKRCKAVLEILGAINDAAMTRRAARSLAKNASQKRSTAALQRWSVRRAAKAEVGSRQPSRPSRKRRYSGPRGDEGSWQHRPAWRSDAHCQCRHSSLSHSQLPNRGISRSSRRPLLGEKGPGRLVGAQRDRAALTKMNSRARDVSSGKRQGSISVIPLAHRILESSGNLPQKRCTYGLLKATASRRLDQ